MSLAPRRTLRPLVAVLCACACLVAMFLLAHAAAHADDGPPSPLAPLAAEIGSVDTAVEDGDVDDEDAVGLPAASALRCGRGTTPYASAPRAVTAGTDPPQSPPPEA